jgi:hypothetical protein
MRIPRVQLGTLLFVIAILALLLVVVVQQVQIGRMQSQIGQMTLTIDANAKSRDQLTTIIREQRDQIERNRR